jgi:hypothetical protein
VGHPPIRRSANGFLKAQPKPREPMLVRERPEMVRRGTQLTDGESGYEVVDRHVRLGHVWFKIENIETRLSAWFQIEDMGELAFGRGETRATRGGF